MRILEVCPYSSGICGVWSRVQEESKRLIDKGHEVRVFSSNFTKGSNKIAPKNDFIDKITIRRFKALKPRIKPLNFLPGGESYMFWNFVREAVEYSPDIIITHNYRHFHNELALIVKRKLKKKGKKCKTFLVTHAPFPEGDITRTFWGHSATWFYDYFIGKRQLNKFDKILTISKWEIPFLKKIGVRHNKISYIPNGIPEDFFTQKQSKEEHKIMFLGRIAPKKKIETLIESIEYLNDKTLKLEIVGPGEEPYFSKIKKIINKSKFKHRIKISEPVYDINEKIRKIDSCKIYVLPSRVEGMPQSLIEAMARGKIVIGSDSLAIRDLIKDKSNGYLFEFLNSIDLASKINLALKLKGRKVQNNAKNSVKVFNWKNVIFLIEKVLKGSYNTK